MSPTRVLLSGVLALALAAAASSCGPAAPACTTDCANVAGTYSANIASVDASRSTCKSLSFTGYTGSVQIALTQSGSSVFGGFWGLSGTIDSKLGFQTPAQSIIIHNDGTCGETGFGESGTISLSGVFSGEEGSRNFAGNFVVTRTKDGCMLPVPTQWVQVGQ